MYYLCHRICERMRLTSLNFPRKRSLDIFTPAWSLTLAGVFVSYNRPQFHALTAQYTLAWS